MKRCLVVLLSVAPLMAQGSTDVAEPLVDLEHLAPTVEQGRAVFAEREQGHCVLCHAVSTLDVPFQGDVGPAMDGIGARLTPAQIRYRIIDASQLNPDTIMPPYFRSTGLQQVATEHAGQTVLIAEQIEQLVFYLSELKD